MDHQTGLYSTLLSFLHFVCVCLEICRFESLSKCPLLWFYVKANSVLASLLAHLLKSDWPSKEPLFSWLWLFEVKVKKLKKKKISVRFLVCFFYFASFFILTRLCCTKLTCYCSLVFPSVWFLSLLWPFLAGWLCFGSHFLCLPQLIMWMWTLVCNCIFH